MQRIVSGEGIGEERAGAERARPLVSSAPPAKGALPEKKRATGLLPGAPGPPLPELHLVPGPQHAGAGVLGVAPGAALVFLPGRTQGVRAAEIRHGLRPRAQLRPRGPPVARGREAGATGGPPEELVEGVGSGPLGTVRFVLHGFKQEPEYGELRPTAQLPAPSTRLAEEVCGGTGTERLEGSIQREGVPCGPADGHFAEQGKEGCA